MAAAEAIVGRQRRYYSLMPDPRTMIFADGENLVMRYQAMLKTGLSSRDGIRHIPDVFTWSGQITRFTNMNIVRVSYYTSTVGDDLKIKETQRAIAEERYFFSNPDSRGSGQLYPHVFKKSSTSQKTRSVDIMIAIDMMRHSRSDSIDRLFLLSGDGDYLPLVDDIIRHGKQVVVGAFSSGLNPELRSRVDDFVTLDQFFFGP